MAFLHYYLSVEKHNDLPAEQNVRTCWINGVKTVFGVLKYDEKPAGNVKMNSVVTETIPFAGGFFDRCDFFSFLFLKAEH